MNKYYPVSLLLLLFWCSTNALAGDRDSSRLRGPGKEFPVNNILMTEQRSFPQMDQLLVENTTAVTSGSLFTTEYLNSMFVADSSVNAYQQKAQEDFDKLDKSNHYTDALGPDDLNELPIGLSQQIGNTVVKIAISNAIFYPGYAELTVYAKMEIPQNPKKIFFGVKGLKLSYSGGIIGDAKLVLLGNIPININGGSAAIILKGGMDMKTGQGLDQTYVTMDCSGFKELSISADIMFPRSLLTPLDKNNERVKDSSSVVKASFQTTVRDWNDVLVDITLPAFEITSLKDFGFHIGKAVYDGSDIRNSTDIVYPKGYAERYMPGTRELWRGVYLKDLEIILPRQFSKGKNTKERVAFGAKDLVIDNNGISGTIFGQNILPAGSASGWRFSVDKFNIDLEANHLTGAGFDGTIQLPVSSTPFAYTAIISADNEYLLKMSTLKKLSFDVWGAKADLDSNSWVQLKLANGAFEPEANLNGRIGISTSGVSPSDTSKNKKEIVSFQGIKFTNLHLQTKAPYLTAAYFGYNDDAKFSNFPVTITEIGLSANDKNASLTFGVKVNLMSGNFGGETKVTVVGAFEEKGDYQTWKYEKLQLDLISIHAELGSAMTIDGSLQIMRDDPVYGDAIGGTIKMKVLNGKVKVDARALFGSKDFRYWYVEAKADLGLGIMVIPPIAVNGFGGGAYYHMKKDGVNMQASLTGVNYVPDETTGLGLKATVLFSVGEKVANGEVTFEVAFNNSGGINFMGFYGYATILKVIPGINNITDRLGKKFQQLAEAEARAIRNLGGVGEKLAALKVSNPTAAAQELSKDEYRVGETGLSAYVGIQYDFTSSTFHSNFDVYINAAGGIIKGSATGNRAGWAVIHIAPGEWYFYMGTPENRLGVKFSIGSINIQTGAYLMAGDNIPGSPPPPQEVADILGMELSQLDYMRDLNATGGGKGFAFGANLSVETGDITFLILYANFKCGVGFDIMLKNYGEAHCVGKTEPIGMDGWYANGQSYVYLQGEVGVKVNLRFIKGRFPIISGAAAVLMQAKLPNPTWMRGYMAVKFRVLGGLVKGNIRMKITLGEECEIVNGSGSPIEVQMIADVTPADKSNAVDVFSAPQAAFNMSVGKVFAVQEDDGSNKAYRSRLSAFTITDNGVAIPGELKWNDNGDAVSFYSKELLPSNRPLKAYVKITFEELVNGNWQTFYANGKECIEEKTVEFTTGTAPDYIPASNLQYTYPAMSQQNFYKDEYAQGFAALRRGQAYLFDPRWKYEIRITDAAGNTKRADMSYDSLAQVVRYNQPALATGTVYRFDVIAIPPGASDKDTVAGYQQPQKSEDDEDGSYEVASNKARVVTRGDVVKSLLNYSFKSSTYKTFGEKIGKLKLKDGLYERVTSDVIRLLADVGDYEGFDVAEMTGNNGTAYQPLVVATATLEDAYFGTDINPILYQSQTGVILNRDINIFGRIPEKGLLIMPGYLAQAAAGGVTSWFKTRLPYLYDLPFVYKADFIDLQTQAVSRYINTGESSVLLNAAYPFMRYGNYRVKYQYVLPDGTRTTNAMFDYYNSLKIR